MENPDQEWLQRVQRGDAQACAELIRCYHIRLYQFARQLTADSAAAEELTLETFTVAWEKIGEFRGPAGLKTWLLRILYRRFLDGKKKSQRRHHAWHQASKERTALTDETASDPLVESEDADRLWHAVAQLSDVDRAVIQLHYKESLSFQEMALVLGQPLGTIKWRLSRALAQLRSDLSIKALHEHQ